MLEMLTTLEQTKLNSTRNAFWSWKLYSLDMDKQHNLDCHIWRLCRKYFNSCVKKKKKTVAKKILCIVSQGYVTNQ